MQTLLVEQTGLVGFGRDPAGDASGIGSGNDSNFVDQVSNVSAVGREDIRRVKERGIFVVKQVLLVAIQHLETGDSIVCVPVRNVALRVYVLGGTLTNLIGVSLGEV